LRIVGDWDETKAAALLERWENKPVYYEEEDI
jgi:hypothetical protein